MNQVDLKEYEEKKNIIPIRFLMSICAPKMTWW